MSDIDPIEFKTPWKNLKPVTIWLSEDEKALYDELAKNHNVKTNREVKRAGLKRLNEIKDSLLKETA